MKNIFLSLALMLISSLSLFAQIEGNKEYYIQTKEGLCLTNQYTSDELALIRFIMPDASHQAQRWTFKPVGDGFVLINNTSAFVVDNLSTAYLNLVQRNAAADSLGQQWKFTPIEGKEGYYSVSSVQFPSKNWSVNYNGAVSLAAPNLYKTSQWFRLSETVLPADDVTQPDDEPIYTPGVQKITFSNAESPVWYKMNAYYASSGTVNKSNMIAYYENGNSRWIVKGGSNTKVGYSGFKDPEVAMWRFEGTEASFRLVNKATGLKLAYPASAASQQRFLLNETGSTFKLGRADALNNAMAADAFYIDPTDESLASIGRVNVDGSAAEFILYKNGVADITGGKGSTLVFMTVPVKTIDAVSSDYSLGEVKIKDEDAVTGYASGAFVFSPSDTYASVASLTRSAAASVTIVAQPKGYGKFVKWVNAVDESLLSTSSVLEYTDSPSLSIKAVFAIPTGLEAAASEDYDMSFYIEEGNTYLVGSPNVETVILFDLSGRRLLSASGQRLNIAGIQKGSYLVSLENKKGDVFTKKLILK